MRKPTKGLVVNNSSNQAGTAHQKGKYMTMITYDYQRYKVILSYSDGTNFQISTKRFYDLLQGCAIRGARMFTERMKMEGVL